MQHFNDAPILTPKDDKFGTNPFAEMLAKSIVEIKSPVGVSIAINGPWGSGKSSAVNLILHHLSSVIMNKELEVIDFKCWWFRGEEALTLAFLQELNAYIGKSLGDKARDIIPKLGRNLLQAGPVIGPATTIATGNPLTGLLARGTVDFTKKFFSGNESVEKLFGTLSNALEEQDKRFLVVIDDMDRLTPDEAILIFRLVKSVGRLPNVIYLLVFDRGLAEEAVNKIYPSEGPHFLEKIIQANFDLPIPTQDDLNNAALSQIQKICGTIEDRNQFLRFMNCFYDVVSPYLVTPRDLTRLTNALTVTWPVVSGEINIADYVVIEVIRLFEPAVYKNIRQNKDRLCGVKYSYGGEKESPEDVIKRYSDLVKDDCKDTIKAALQRLFPRLEDIGYSSDFISQWESQRLICTNKYFDTYFRMSIGEDVLSSNEINSLIKNSNDVEYIKKTFHEAFNAIRRNGKSKVPLLFDELNAHADKIDKAHFKSLISAIFEISDEIDRVEDYDGQRFSGDNTRLRIHWLIRNLTFKRCDLNERSKIFVSAAKNSQLVWMLDFTSSCVDDYNPHEGQNPSLPEKCLVLEEHLEELKERALAGISSEVENKRLITNPYLDYILYRWSDFSNEGGEDVKRWCNNQLKDDIAVAMFANAFTKETWSQGIGMFSLGDRVAMRNTAAATDGLDTIMDAKKFRERLEDLKNKDNLEPPLNEYVQVFLEAWEQKEAEKDD